MLWHSDVLAIHSHVAVIHPRSVRFHAGTGSIHRSGAGCPLPSAEFFTGSRMLERPRVRGMIPNMRSLCHGSWCPGLAATTPGPVVAQRPMGASRLIGAARRGLARSDRHVVTTRRVRCVARMDARVPACTDVVARGLPSASATLPGPPSDTRCRNGCQWPREWLWSAGRPPALRAGTRVAVRGEGRPDRAPVAGMSASEVQVKCQ